jgi:predicted dehydrogenase
MMKPVTVGVVGCGNISGVYLRRLQDFENVAVVACADLLPDRAKESAEEYGILKACSVDDLLADPSIEIVLNLAIPKVHGEVALQALEAGKSVYNEKPLAMTREEGEAMLARAASKGLLVGGAPDTFMGAGIQTCRKLIDDGWIGEPVAATAFMMGHGHENWHPDPDFFYQPGGGPLFDMGPYYLTALVNLMGQIRHVAGSARATFPERVVTSEEKHGEVITVNTPTHIAGTLDFANGAIGTVIMSFDVWAHSLPHIEVHGTTGSMQVPDPNGFGGTVRIRRGRVEDWSEMPLSHSYGEESRGVGVADMACALRTGRAHRASGDLTYHVLDVMHAFLDTAQSGRRVRVKSKCKRPAPMPMDLRDGQLDQ